MLNLAKDKLTPDEVGMISSFLTWIRESVPGDAIVYHTGVLYNARPGVSKVARHMLESYGRGELELTQKRLGNCQYEYIATKRKKKIAPQSFCLPPLEPMDLVAA